MGSGPPDLETVPPNSGWSALPPVQEMLENTTDCVAVLDQDWTFTYLNSAAVAALGGVSLVGRALPTLFEEERESEPWLLTRQAAATRQPAHFEFYGSGLAKWFEVHVHPIPSGLLIFFRDITDRKSAELALRESEERLRLALEAARDGAWDWDLANDKFSLATSLVETMGYGSAPLRVLASDFVQIIHRDDIPRLSVAVTAHLKSLTDGFQTEFRTRAVDGSWRWVLVRGRVVARDAVSGRATRMLGISSDITERKQSESRVLEHANLLALAEEAAGAGAWSMELQTLATTISPSARRLIGLPDTHCGTVFFGDWAAFVHPDDQAAPAAALRTAIDTAGDYSAEYRVRTADGGWRWLQSLGRLVEDPSCSQTRLIGLIMDVTDRKLAAEALHNSEQRLRLALDAAGDGAWDWRVATGEVQRSPRLLKRLGYGPDDLEATRLYLSRLVHPDDLPNVVRAGREYIDGESDAYVAEYRLLSASGDWFWVLERGRAVEWDPATGRPSRIVGTGSDITARKRAEIDLHRVQAELIHLSRLSAMGAMASTLAHELNQPLTAISNYARGIRHHIGDLSGNPVLKDGLDELEASSQRAGEIVRHLRNYVTRGEIERKPWSIAEIVKETCALALIDARSIGVDYAIDLDQGADLVLVDRIQIQQVILNLIRNAVEAMTAAGPRRFLRISSRREGRTLLRLSVEDSGPGISDAILPDLFTPFVSGKADGMGVGLSICRTIVEAHEGSIWTEPNPDNGSMIHFTVPLAPALRSAGGQRVTEG